MYQRSAHTCKTEKARASSSFINFRLAKMKTNGCARDAINCDSATSSFRAARRRDFTSSTRACTIYIYYKPIADVINAGNIFAGWAISFSFIEYTQFSCSFVLKIMCFNIMAHIFSVSCFFRPPCSNTWWALGGGAPLAVVGRWCAPRPSYYG